MWLNFGTQHCDYVQSLDVKYSHNTSWKELQLIYLHLLIKSQTCRGLPFFWGLHHFSSLVILHPLCKKKVIDQCLLFMEVETEQKNIKELVDDADQEFTACAFQCHNQKDLSPRAQAEEEFSQVAVRWRWC